MTSKETVKFNRILDIILEFPTTMTWALDITHLQIMGNAPFTDFFQVSIC